MMFLISRMSWSLARDGRWMAWVTGPAPRSPTPRRGGAACGGFNTVVTSP